MSNASKYRKKAVEFEQLKQFDRAVASYVRAIEENENAGEDVDVALFNKVGDLTLRQGRVTEAVTYYERAVEHYVSNSLFDNAIALCNKILRNAPGRSNVYFTLGRICGRKGLRADATRNFLEYATRMQQEGRVDEGMRALAEVADLMPELTEVRRLVEEHAARAGISLAPKRRNTPVRPAAQAEPEPSRLFGLSKDLVFLEIDYDAVKAARGLTPPPQRSVAGEANAPRPKTASQPAISAPTAPTPAPAPVAPKSSAIEDLMIFDPRGETNALDAFADDVVVDGTPIIKPYADTTAPVASLDDLEPNVVKGTPAYNEVVEAVALPDMLERGVAPRAPGEERQTTPVAVTRVLTVPNFPAVLETEDVEQLDDLRAGIVEELFVEPVVESPMPLDVEFITPADVVGTEPAEETVESIVSLENSEETAEPELVADVVEVDEPVAIVDEPVAVDDEAVSFDETVVVDNVIFDSFPVETAEEISVEVAAEFESNTVADVVETVESQVEAAPSGVIAMSDVVDHHGDSNSTDESDRDILNFVVEHELAQSAPTVHLEGFTADEEPPVPNDIVVTEDVGVMVVEPETVVLQAPEPDVMPSLDFDAMLDMSTREVDAIADLQAEEFEPTGHDIALTPFARAEAEAEAELVDAFDSAGELPPLIFPTELEAPTVVALDLIEAPSVIEYPEIIELDIPEVDNIELGALAELPEINLSDDLGDFIDIQTVESQNDVGELIDVVDLSTANSDVVGQAADIVFLDVADAGAPAFTPIELDVVTTTPLDFVALEVADASDTDSLGEIVTSVQDVVHAEGGFDSFGPTTRFDSSDELSLDDSYDTTFDPTSEANRELPFIVSSDLIGEELDELYVEAHTEGPQASEIVAAEDSIVEFVEVVADVDVDADADVDACVSVEADAEHGLDDLFGDTGVRTAIVAAEATIVASSRLAELQSASDENPGNFGLRRRLAEALFEAGNRDEAIAQLGVALADAERSGSLTDAAEMADELVHVAADEVAHHQKRLELAIRIGDQSRLREAYLDLADNLVRRGEDLRAKAVYARVLEIDPWDDRARTALGDAAPPPPAQSPASGSDDGHVSLADWLREDDAPVSTRLRMPEPDISGDEQDDFNALLKHFKEGVARSLGEDDHESHYDLGVAYKEMGLLDDAIGEFQMALRSRGNRLAAYEALGQCFIEQQSYKVAVTVLSRALHEPSIQDEQRVGVLYLLGISCEVLQRFDEARGYFQRVYATDIHFRDVAQRLADLERTVR